MTKVNILGIGVFKLSKKEALAIIKRFLAGNTFHQIVTPNPEIILASLEDEELFYILNESDLALADGMGVKLAALFSSQYIVRFTGADLVRDLLGIAEAQGLKVAVINFSQGLSTRTEIERSVKDLYKNLDIFVENAGRDSGLLSREFLDFKPAIVFVNLGAPYQEKFIYHNISKVSGVKVAVGVGGSFDFLTGKSKRAPVLLRALGLEWLWRLILSPARIQRIFNATFKFCYKFLLYKLCYPFLYRSNVACLLYKKEQNKYKILVVERQDERGHWQLPQGGTDGENLMAAGLRELREELNTNKIVPKRAFKNVYKYKIGARPGETSAHKYRSKKDTGFKGQKQGLFIAEFSGKDEDIKVNFWDHARWKWVDSDKLMDSVHLIRRKGVVKFLNCFDDYLENNS